MANRSINYGFVMWFWQLRYDILHNTTKINFRNVSLETSNLSSIFYLIFIIIVIKFESNRIIKICFDSKSEMSIFIKPYKAYSIYHEKLCFYDKISKNTWCNLNFSINFVMLPKFYEAHRLANRSKESWVLFLFTNSCIAISH